MTAKKTLGGTLGLLVVLTFGFTGDALAADFSCIKTAPLSVNVGDFFRCSALNVTGVERGLYSQQVLLPNITLDIISGAGALLATNTGSIGSGAVRSVVYAATSAADNLATCIVCDTSHALGPRKFRKAVIASFCTIESGNNRCQGTVTAP